MDSEAYHSRGFRHGGYRRRFEIPIMLGKPFHVTPRAVIDVKCEKLTFEVGDENIEFLLPKLIKSPTFKDSFCRFDLVEKHVNELMD